MFGFAPKTMMTTAVRNNSKVKINSNQSKKLNLTFNDVESNYEIFIRESFEVAISLVFP